jgi:hypothetical protein
MKLKAYIICLFLILACNICFAQTNKVTFTGKVVDKESGKVIPSCSINAVLGKEIISTTTDSLGTFKLNLETNAKYIIAISSIGYKRKDSLITANGLPHVFELSSETVTLSEVQIIDSSTGQRKYILDIDKLIVQPEKKLLESSISTIDVIKTLPMISVENDQIKLKGKNNILIFIDGLKSSYERLRSLNPNTIQNIELITSPPIQYSEYDGIINVVLKKVDKGIQSYEGFISPSVGNRNYLDGFTSFGFRSDGFYANLSFQYNQVETDFNNRAFTIDKSNNNTFSQIGEKRVSQDFLYGGLSLTYVNKKNLFNIELNAFEYNFDRKNNFEIFRNGQILTDTAFNTKSVRRTYNTNFNYKYTIVAGKEIQLSYQNKINKNNDGIIDRFNLGENIENTLLIDYSHNTKVIGFNGGIKYINRTTNSSFTDATLRSLNTSQNVPVLFSSISFKKKDISFRLGTQVLYNNYKVGSGSQTIYSFERLHISPSVLISKTLPKSGTLKLTYNNKLLTPGLYYVNPFLDNSDIITSKQGNPNIKPENQHILNFEYAKTINTNYLSLSIETNINKNKITVLPEVINASIVNQFLNSSYQDISLNSYYSKTINKKHSLNVSLNIINAHIKTGSHKNNMINYNYSFGFNYNLFKTGYLNISTSHYAPEIMLKGKQTTLFYNGISYQQSFLSGFAFSLKANYPFNLGTEQNTKLDLNPYSQNIKSSINLQSYIFGVSYKFGKANSTRSNNRAKGINNTDVKDKNNTL